MTRPDGERAAAATAGAGRGGSGTAGSGTAGSGTASGAPPAPAGDVAAAVALRLEASARFFDAEAERLARLCHEMAQRFARGGRLIAFGATPAARSDARHVAVEFVHPVIVGKRALPALAACPEGGPLRRQAELLVEPDDVAMAFAAWEGPGEKRRGEGGRAEPEAQDRGRAEDGRAEDGRAEDGGRAAGGAGGTAAGGAGQDETAAALEVARRRGAATVLFGAAGAGAGAAGDGFGWHFDPRSGDPFVDQEVIETGYHVLWELVHVFFEHRGLLAGRAARPVHDAGASGFLYPFLSESETDLDAVLADVAASVCAKAAEVGALRRRTLTEADAVLAAAAATLAERLAAGGRILALGNGGSATDAMDLVADLRAAPQGWPARSALDLTEDPGILTALANDIGPESLFARQVIAYGRERDAVVALTTSGGSANVLAALAEARRRGLATVAFVGYDGGRIAAEGLADHVIVTRSEHVPRIQEAQASAYHLLRERLETALGGR